MINTKFILIFISIFISVTTQAKYVPDLIAAYSLENVALSAIEYSLLDQVSETDHKLYWAGEFKTKIQSSLIPSLVGVGRAFGEDDEATAFTTAVVVNQLAQVYLDNPQLQGSTILSKIPDSINKAVKTYDRYRDGFTYNFYPSRTLKDGQVVRRPINMTLFPLWHGFTNIPNDSDTSSAVLTSLIYQAKINQTKSEVAQQSIDEISSFVDLDRNPMYYNRIEKRKKTGAFMTWLMSEKDEKMPRFFFASSAKGKRIPFNKNDVDCIVNANIIKLLALSKKTSPGYASACLMLNDMVKKDENATCGVYYPNTYNLGFALAGLSQAGDQCLQVDNKTILIKKILSEQNADGSWTNIKNIWTDEVLSTAFALTSLMEFGDLQDDKLRSSVFYGAQYLLKNAQLKHGRVYWVEDNFFTATAIARSLIMWRSKAYTNTIIAGLLLKMHRLYPQLKVNNYVTLNFGVNQ